VNAPGKQGRDGLEVGHRAGRAPMERAPCGPAPQGGRTGFRHILPAMIHLTRKLPAPVPAAATATLTHDQRQRRRLRVLLDDGRDAGILLDRAEGLRDGDCLAADDGLVVAVRAAAETLSCAAGDDHLLLARACYHLGNRHVPLQISTGRLCYAHDHVLDDMVRGLGLSVTCEQAPFEPEPGAYGGVQAEHGQHHGH
jgi:urease accessory protein